MLVYQPIPSITIFVLFHSLLTAISHRQLKSCRWKEKTCVIQSLALFCICICNASGHANLRDQHVRRPCDHHVGGLIDWSYQNVADRAVPFRCPPCWVCSARGRGSFRTATGGPLLTIGWDRVGIGATGPGSGSQISYGADGDTNPLCPDFRFKRNFNLDHGRTLLLTANTIRRRMRNHVAIQAWVSTDFCSCEDGVYLT